MNKADSSPRWYAPWRQGEKRLADDPADLGTAFGLDLSLTPESTKAEPPEDSQPGWMQRLVARRKPAQ